MNETIPTGQEKPVHEHSTDENTNKPEKIVIENSPLNVVVNKGQINWGTITETILVVITIVLAIYTVRYASAQAHAAMVADSIAIESLKYQAKTDSENAIKQDKKDALFQASQYTRDSLNRESFILGNRAYIVFCGFDPINFKLDGEETTINYWVKNVGQTPAFNLKPYSFIVEIEDSLGKYIREGEAYLKRHIFEGENLGTNDSISHIFHWKKLTMQDHNTIIKNKILLYFGGMVGYQDIFKVPHITYFCITFRVGINEIGTYKKYNELK